jgi:hypothetical protein
MESKRAERPKRSLRRRLLFWAMYAFFLLVVLEVALQGFYYVMVGDFLFARVALPIYVAHEHANHWNKPDLDMVHATNEFRALLRTNSQGFRVADPDVEYAHEKDPSRYRIMLLGPSFAYGWGVNYEDSFGAKLEAALERAGFADGKDIELINAGVPSLRNRNQLAWYEHDGRRFEPDMLVQFCYGSMVIPPAANPRVDEAGHIVVKSNWKTRLRARLKKSAIVFYGWILLQSISGGDEGGTVEGAGRELTMQEDFDPADADVVDSMPYYEQLRRVTGEDGTRLVLLHFPLSYCIHRGDVSRWKHLGVRNVDQQIAYEDAFCRHLTDAGYECLNITPELVAAAETGDRLYYWLDIHWTPRGNEEAANAVTDRLLAE